MDFKGLQLGIHHEVLKIGETVLYQWIKLIFICELFSNAQEIISLRSARLANVNATLMSRFYSFSHTSFFLSLHLPSLLFHSFSHSPSCLSFLSLSPGLQMLICFWTPLHTEFYLPVAGIVEDLKVIPVIPFYWVWNDHWNTPNSKCD